MGFHTKTLMPTCPKAELRDQVVLSSPVGLGWVLWEYPGLHNSQIQRRDEHSLSIYCELCLAEHGDISAS